MRPLFLSLPACVLLAALAAAVPLREISARQDGAQSEEKRRGAAEAEGCVTVMGRTVCPNGESTSPAVGLAPAAVAALLFAEGPQISPSNDKRGFAIQGFARSGWPVAVDFLPRPGSLTVLVVTPYDPAPPAGLGLGKAIRDATGGSALVTGSVRVVMDADGKSGRRLFAARLDLPAPQGASDDRPLGIATYTVESYRISAKGKLSLKRSPVEIFGFGAGPAAVGAAAAGRGRRPPARAASPALANLMLPAPMSLSQAVLADAKKLKRPATGKRAVNYRYRRTSPFHFVAEDVWLEKGGQSVRSVFQRLLKSPSLPNPVTKPVTYPWMLAPGPTNVAGQYRLVVRAWLKCDKPVFTSCKGADFVVARSAAVDVQ